MSAEAAYRQLREYLARWERRRRAGRSLAWGARGLTAALVMASALALAGRIWPLLPASRLAWLGAAWAITAMLLAALAARLAPRPPLEQARWFDRQLGLAERTSTAIELRDRRPPLRSVPLWMAEEQLADALRRARKVDPRNALPLRLDRRDWLPATVAAAALAALLWLPNPMQRVLDERTAAREAILEEVHTLETVRQEIASDPLLTEQNRQQMLQILDEALERLERNELSREEALAELTEAADRLRSLTDPSAEQRAIALSQAAETMKASPVAAALADALSEGDLQLAAAILEDLADELGQELTREQELELAEQLAGAAVRLANTNAELAEQFSQAAEGIRSGDLSGARQALAEAAQTTAETGQAAAASTVAQAGANRMGQAGQRVAQSGST